MSVLWLLNSINLNSNYNIAFKEMYGHRIDEEPARVEHPIKQTHS